MPETVDLTDNDRACGQKHFTGIYSISKPVGQGEVCLPFITYFGGIFKHLLNKHDPFPAGGSDVLRQFLQIRGKHIHTTPPFSISQSVLTHVTSLPVLIAIRIEPA